MDSFSYLVGVCLSDGSLFRTEGRYVFSMECKSEAFVQRVASALSEVLHRSVRYFPMRRSNWKTSTIRGLKPNYVFNGFKITVKCRPIWQELVDCRDMILRGEFDRTALVAKDVLIGVVDGDGHITSDGRIVIRTPTPDAVVSIARWAGFNPRVYDYPHQTAPQVDLRASESRTIDTFKKQPTV